MGARSTQADNRNALTADTILNRRDGGPRFKRVGYVEGARHRESSRLGVTGCRHCTHDVLCIAVYHVARRPVLLRATLAAFVDGDVRPSSSVAADFVSNRGPIGVVHETIMLGVGGDLHRMNSTTYPVIRFSGASIAGLLNGAGARDSVLNKTGNPDGLDNIRFNAYAEPDLFTERGEAVSRRHARGRR